MITVVFDISDDIQELVTTLSSMYNADYDLDEVFNQYMVYRQTGRNPFAANEAWRSPKRTRYENPANTVYRWGQTAEEVLRDPEEIAEEMNHDSKLLALAVDWLYKRIDLMLGTTCRKLLNLRLSTDNLWLIVSVE